MALERAPDVDLSAISLFLDLDGTLANFEIEPSGVGPDLRRSAILNRLDATLNGRLAIVSGRTIADIDRILDCQVEAVSGVHGLERRVGADRFDARSHPAVGPAHRALIALADDHPGLIVEMKGSSVALHYRARPDLAATLAKLVAEVGQAVGLVLQTGNKVWELRTPGPDKGDAVRAFMAEPPFAGARPVYLGDDLTDESAFRAADALGGFGVRVGAPSRPTAARYRIDDVDDVLHWLEGLGPTPVSLTRDRAGAHV